MSRIPNPACCQVHVPPGADTPVPGHGGRQPRGGGAHPGAIHALPHGVRQAR
jgi:hypothetical protein